MIVFSQPAAGKFSTRYQIYKASGGTYTPGAFGSLASLADNDNITIPDIHARIVANLKVKDESEMKAYTNTIPGTGVSYAMAPIPGGEFIMGSPDSEKARKPDEGPQHKVKISPFWMGQCEITWNEYELFMYPGRGTANAGHDPDGRRRRQAGRRRDASLQALRRNELRHGQGRLSRQSA